MSRRGRFLLGLPFGALVAGVVAALVEGLGLDWPREASILFFAVSVLVFAAPAGPGILSTTLGLGDYHPGVSPHQYEPANDGFTSGLFAVAAGASMVLLGTGLALVAWPA